MGSDAATPTAPPAGPHLPDDVDSLKRMILELLAQIHDRDRELSGVQQRLDQLLRRLYGPKGERFRPDQPGLFDLLSGPEPAATPEPPPDPQPEPAAPSKRGRRHGRRRLPADLPRQQFVHDVSESEKTCPCCRTPRVKIGEEVSEQLDYRPAKLFVWQHVRLKYACPTCAKTAATLAVPTTAKPSPSGVEPPASVEPSPQPIGSLVVVIAAKPAQPIDKGLAGPGLLAHVLTSKYADHLPLHRQEGMLARNGVELTRSTLCDWVAAAADLLRPLYDAMLSDILLSRVVQTDETRVPVLEPQLRKTKSGRLWVFVGDRNHPLTVYAVEDEASGLIAQHKLSGDEADAVRLRLRREKTKPRLAAFAAWLDSEAKVVLPKSPIAQAIAYSRVTWERGFPVGIKTNLSTFLTKADAIFAIAPIASLDLSGQRLRDAEARALAECTNLKNLTSLNLRYNGIGDAGARALAGSPNFKNLTSLDLGYNGIGDAGARALAGSTNLKNLTLLNLWASGIGDAGARALAESPNLKHVTYLNLGLNGIGDGGAQALAESTNFKNLTSLDLGRNGIGDAGAQALAESPNLKHVTYLNLGLNRIDGGGAMALAEGPHFRRDMHILLPAFKGTIAELRDHLARNRVNRTGGTGGPRR